ncbi:MAG: FdtA/QdtA family cupin domain-containing protein [Candidatus Cloacimonetes bacterium]|nr:FdtA/QdtA family cupin domain-containing protein [Candidatus Cloacimonadota bacterium]
MKVNNARIINLEPIIDGIDGYLCVAENQREIPFEIKRVYYIYNLDSPQAVRGKHAHRELEQVLFCLKGSFDLLLDDGFKQEKILMENPQTGIYMGTGVWHIMDNFSKDCVIMVLASDYFTEKDYIRDYDEFTRFKNR